MITVLNPRGPGRCPQTSRPDEEGRLADGPAHDARKAASVSEKEIWRHLLMEKFVSGSRDQGKHGFCGARGFAVLDAGEESDDLFCIESRLSNSASGGARFGR